MARGSSKTGGGAGASQATQIGGQEGSIAASGKYVVRKRFLVSNESDLTKVPPPPQGMLATAINWTYLGGGAFEQTVDYEHYKASTDSEVVQAFQGVEGRFELDLQDEMAPIEKHPEIRQLIETYQGKVDYETGKVTFPITYTPVASGGLSAGGGGEKTNPMAGLRYYTKVSGIFRHTQQTEQIPANIWSNVGKKVTKLPANFPNPAPFTNKKGERVEYYWIVLSPQIYRRGNAYEIVRSYRLSDPNVPDEVYLTDVSYTNTS
jgi:hypothetical protein